MRRIPRGELERIGLWPGARSDAPEEVQRLQAELERARGELRELRLLPMKVDAERKARGLIEASLHQERAEKQSLELQLREIEQARVDASSRLETLSQAGFLGSPTHPARAASSVTPAPRGRSGLVEVLTAQGGESFYRLVRSDPPALDSFRSQRELGGRRQPRPNALFLLAVGVSMFDTLDGALRVALRRPALVGRSDA